MGTLYTRTFTAADGTQWESADFERVVGNSAATITSNAGRCGGVAEEKVYLATAYTGTPNVLMSVALDWFNAPGAGRAAGLVARFSDDGDDGYVAEIDSNINAARVRFRRRNAGVWTAITAWTAIDGAPFSVTGLVLNAGVTAILRVEDVTGGVKLTLTVAGSVVLTYTDTDASRLERTGRCGLRIDSVSTGADITFDTLTVQDLESEYSGTPTDLDTGVALIVDGVYYAEADLITAKVSVGRIGRSLTSDQSVEFVVPALMDAADSILYPGAVVEVQVDGTTVAYGRIQPSSRALRPGEGRVYELLGLRGLAADVPIEDPGTRTPGANTMTWNLDPTHAEYDSTRAGKTVGEAIKELLDGHDDGDTGLRAHLAGPLTYTTPIYVQAELDLLTKKVPGMSASGDVLSGVEQLLAFTSYYLDILPATRIWHVKPRLGGTIRQVDIDATHVLGDYRIDPSRNFTAAIVQGERPEITQTAMDNGVTMAGHVDALGLSPAWEPSLEASATSAKQVTNRAVGLVASVAGTVGEPEVTIDAVGPPAFSMTALEWQGCELQLTSGAEAGNAYEVETNDGTKFVVVGPWLAGGPSAGDAFAVYGTAAQGGRDNGYTEIGRKYELDNVDLGIAPDICARVELIAGEKKMLTTAAVDTPSDPAQPATVTLDLPSIGLVNFTSQAHDAPCEAGGAGAEARVELTLPTYDRTDPRVANLWYPSSGTKRGYTGTAYSFDAAKYAGGGRPGKGDVGVMRPYPLNMPEYDGSAAQQTEVEGICAEILTVLGALARSVEVTIPGLSLTVDVGDRLQVLGGPTELETVTDLDVLGVEWDPRAKTTTYYAGTQASGDHDIEAMRRSMVKRNTDRRLKRDLTRVQRVIDCLHNDTHGAQFERGLPPVQVCADQVTSAVTAPQRSVKEDITNIDILVQMLWEWMGKQKATQTTIDDNGIPWIQKDGHWYYTEDGGATWKEQFANDGPTNVPGGSGKGGGDIPADDPMPSEPDDLGEGGIEGIIWQAVLGILGNLGKTIDMATGRVIAPGTINNGTNNPDSSPWVTFGPATVPEGPPTRTPVGGGGTVPPTNEPPKAPVLGNLMKTEEPDGTIPEPGTALPDGGTYHGPGGGLTLPHGGNAPVSMLSHVQADFRMKGMSVVTMQDKGGAVWETPDGNLWRAEALPYEDGTYMRQVTAAAGGAGTGENDGDYDRPVAELVLAPSEHVEFTHAEGDGFTASTPTDGLGLYLEDGSTTSIVTDPIVLPSGAHGYDSGSVKLQVAIRGDTAGDGAGNFRFNVYGTWRPGGGAAETEVQAGSAQVVANPGTGGQTAVVEVTMPKPTDATPGAGTQLAVRVERTGAHASDTATDRMCVLSVGADVPVQAPSVPTSGYTV